VEEFMLLANCAVAEKITSFFPSVALLRRHPSPSPRRFDELVKAGQLVGVDIRIKTSKDLADSLDAAKIPGRPKSNKIFRILATRCMSQAVYFCAGELAATEYRHYGLATPIYTHFTSPIRRYADVVAHRMLAVAIGIESMPTAYQEKSFIHDRCDNINKRNYAAQMAGRASVQLYTRVFFRSRPRVVSATVLHVRSTGVAVLVMEFGFEGFIRVKDEAHGGNWAFNQEQLCLQRPDTGAADGTPARLTVFQEVRVRVEVKEMDAYREEVMLTFATNDDKDGVQDSTTSSISTKEARSKKKRRVK